MWGNMALYRINFKDYLVFSNIDIHIDNNLILKNIGIYKNDHIFNIIINQNTTQKWLERYNEYHDEYDIRNLYKLSVCFLIHGMMLSTICYLYTIMVGGMLVFPLFLLNL